MLQEIVIGIAGAVGAAAVIGIYTLIRRAVGRKKDAAQTIVRLILQWHHYIDTKLESSDYNPAELNAIESEIYHHFSSPEMRHFTLRFNARFIGTVLARQGLKRELQGSIPLFEKYARIDHPNIKLAVQLSSKADHRKYDLAHFPFQVYWTAILANYTAFHGQFSTGWKNLNDGDHKYTIADVEVPIRVLRLYFDE